ncbi:tetratricopeptide repeat protein [Dinoroseobacter sp. S375]|uniref:tetratricopeptide repeat protein n=1 Tax=Dinoroseobacter sp. S375 TaxID=3415136 RepID=UPI003C7A6AE6
MIRQAALRASVALALVLSVPMTTPVSAAPNGVSGAYLAGRAASLNSNYAEAARYFARALMRDRANPALMESAAIAFLALGDQKSAYPIALKLAKDFPTNQIAGLVLAADILGPDGDPEAEVPGVGPVGDKLVAGWRALEQGQADAAFGIFNEMIEDPRTRAFGIYHKGMALAQVGDFEGALAMLTEDGSVAASLSGRAIIATAQVLAQLDRADEARSLIEARIGRDAPRGAALLDQIDAGTLSFDVVPTPQAGYAEAFFTVAVALNGQASDNFTLLYARVAQTLAPDHIDAILLTASLLENLEQYDLANKAYDQVPRNSPAFLTAEIGRANVLRRAEKPDAAIEVLTQLVETHGSVARVHSALADAHRRMENFSEAAAAYDMAIEISEAQGEQDWVLYYARGIANERIGAWDAAEADLRLALELNPGQPMVLNYLGYSFVELGENMDEALDMIEQAVAARPDNGYITDSLGWVLYRMGDFDEAVPYMERAVALEPLDPIINDHLGDVYYAVGRKREAEFQWKRALSFDPEVEEAERIRRKLEVGLDAVLIEEGAEPTHVARD